MPDKGISKIYVPGSGLVTEVFVSEGDRVSAGEVLLSISQERALATGGGVQTQLIEYLNDQIDFTEKQIVEEQNQAAILERQLKDDISALEQELKQLDNKLSIQEQITADAKSNLDVAERLADQGFVSQIDLTQRRNNYHSSQASEATLKQQVEQTKNSLAGKKSELEAHPGRLENNLGSLKTQLATYRQRLAETKGQKAFSINSPISGRVSGLQVYPGLTTNPNMPLLTVLPEDSRFQAVLFVPTRAIGLIKQGQEVRIFYDAFRYQNFGTYAGVVTEISKTILSPEETFGPITPREPIYRVVVTLQEQEVEGFGETFPLQAGMTLEAVIVLQEQTFFEMLLEPLKALKGRT